MLRAVALADANIRKQIETKFVPLKIVIAYGSKKFPTRWPALEGWADIYQMLGGKENTGLTGCSIITPDREQELASTGSAMVWELFDSIAYNPAKFQAMIAAGEQRWEQERSIRTDKKLTPEAREATLAAFRKAVDKARDEEGKFRLPPEGFSIDGAVDLFTLTGDYTPEEKEKK